MRTILTESLAPIVLFFLVMALALTSCNKGNGGAVSPSWYIVAGTWEGGLTGSSSGTWETWCQLEVADNGSFIAGHGWIAMVDAFGPIRVPFTASGQYSYPNSIMLTIQLEGYVSFDVHGSFAGVNELTGGCSGILEGMKLRLTRTEW